MVEPERNPLGDPSSLKTFIAFVKDYKELVAAIAFFVGGILWVFGYFATKEEFRALSDATSSKHKVLNCLLQKEVKLLEGELQSKVYRDELITLKADLRKKSPKSVQFSEKDTSDIVSLESLSGNIRQDYKGF